MEPADLAMIDSEILDFLTEEFIALKKRRSKDRDEHKAMSACDLELLKLFRRMARIVADQTHKYKQILATQDKEAEKTNRIAQHSGNGEVKHLKNAALNAIAGPTRIQKSATDEHG